MFKFSSRQIDQLAAVKLEAFVAQAVDFFEIEHTERVRERGRETMTAIVRQVAQEAQAHGLTVGYEVIEFAEIALLGTYEPDADGDRGDLRMLFASAGGSFDIVRDQLTTRFRSTKPDKSSENV